jgi:hypothetical protein
MKTIRAGAFAAVSVKMKADELFHARLALSILMKTGFTSSIAAAQTLQGEK